MRRNVSRLCACSTEGKKAASVSTISGPSTTRKASASRANRPDQHQPQRLEPQHPPRPRLDEAIGAIEPDPKRFDGARSEIEGEDRAERQQSAAARGRQNPLAPRRAIGRATTSGHSAKTSFAASCASSAEPKNPATAATKIRNGNSEVSSVQADVAGDRPAVIGGELLRRLPDDSQACAHPRSSLPSQHGHFGPDAADKRHPRERESTPSGAHENALQRRMRRRMLRRSKAAPT